jgi:hypothetical protein
MNNNNNNNDDGGESARLRTERAAAAAADRQRAHQAGVVAAAAADRAAPHPRARAEDRRARAAEHDLREELSGLSREEVVARLIASEQRNRGTYYSTIDQVWRGEARRIGVGDSHLFTVLKRAEAPSFVSHGVANYYAKTIESANNAALVPFPGDRSQSSSMRTPLRQQVWPYSVFAVADTLSPVAHLVPASRDHAATYFDVAIGALALDESGLPWETVQKSIHGAVAPTEAPTTTHPRRVPRRRPHTGIKHSVPNMIRLAGQATFFDQHPCVLIVPAMPLDEVKSWSGGGYSAIVMVGPPRDETVDPHGHVITERLICRGISMLDEGEVATPEQVESARSLLSQFVLGLAYSLFHRLGRYWDQMSGDERREVESLRNNFVNCRGGVVAPELNQGRPWRVRLVTFRGVTEAGDLHVAPDPYLLTVKAAVNWSRRHDQKLLAAAEPQDDDEEIDDLSALDMQRFLDFQRDAARDDLARLVEEKPGGFQVAFETSAPPMKDSQILERKPAASTGEQVVRQRVRDDENDAVPAAFMK